MKWLFSLLISMLFVSLAYGVSKTHTLVGIVQGIGYADPSATIEIAHNGRGTRVMLGSTSHLQEIGLTESKLAMGTKVTATGILSKGKTQDELEAKTIVIDGQTYKLK